MPSPYSLDDHEQVDDPGAWQLWWALNRDPYLRFSRINTGQTTSLGGEFFLGKGERVRTVGGRVKNATIQRRIVPSVLEAMQAGGTNEFMRGSLMALAKIGGHRNLDRFKFTMDWYLDGDVGSMYMNFTAPVALGVLADSRSYANLSVLAKGGKEGRDLYGRKVSEPMRAFAAYGLGLIGATTTDVSLKRRIVKDLVLCLEEQYEDSTDLRVAAITAMGLVPLPVSKEDTVCYCGTCKVADPESSLGSQVTYLLRYFTADREFDPVVRAHTATTLGRLIEAQPEGMSARLKEVVTEFLIGSLQKYSRQPAEVKQSAVLALGLIGDADDDPADRWIRWALDKAISSGGPIEKRFGLVSLAQVGSRRGQGDKPFVGTPTVRRELLQTLKSGKKSLKPWSALAMGVLGYHLHGTGEPLDPSLDLLLRNRLKRGGSADELGAISIAIGLRGDMESCEQLSRRLSSIKDSTARSYASLGLGMAGYGKATEVLQETLLGSQDEPLVASRSGLALGLLGDTEVVETLIETLNKTKNKDTRAAITQALGYIGDERSVQCLVDLMNSDREVDEIRERAVVALGYASDRSKLSWRARIASGVNYLAQSDMLTCGDGSGILDFQ